MSRPAGVTISAVLLILVSAFFLLMCGLMFWMDRTLSETPPSVPFARFVNYFMALVYCGAAAWGIVTAVGLFRTRRWARISILIQSGLAVFFLATSLLMVFLMPFAVPGDVVVSESSLSAAKRLIAVVFCVPLALAVWWLIYFNLASVKAAFLSEAITAQRPRRPLGITVIAWHAIVFGLCTAPFALTQWPAFLFGVVLTGWAARVVYVVFGVGQLAIGVGLLKLKPWSHTTTVGLCLFAIVHAVVFALLPDKWDRMAEFIQYYPADLRRDFPVLPESFFWLGTAVTLALFAPVLWYLFTRKKAFLEAGKPPQVAV
jgi:hypothetical protein